MHAIIPSVLCLLAGALPPAAVVEQERPGVRGEVLAAVEKELERLSKQAAAEAGPVHPRPSSEVAFLILSGLAAQSSQVQEPAPGDFPQLGIAPGDRERLQLFKVADDARVVIRTDVIQDKAGSWTSQRATLYRRQGEKWVQRGSGSTALDGVP